jgi:hypothetical protein
VAGNASFGTKGEGGRRKGEGGRGNYKNNVVSVRWLSPFIRYVSRETARRRGLPVSRETRRSTIGVFSVAEALIARTIKARPANGRLSTPR